MEKDRQVSKRGKRFVWLLTLAIVFSIGALSLNSQHLQVSTDNNMSNLPRSNDSPAAQVLTKLAIKGRAPKTDYTRDQSTNGWNNTTTCDVRNEILQRDLTGEVVDDSLCIVLSGTLHDPYTGSTIQFLRGETTSDDVQIDHVVALSDAWQKGAQQLSYQQRNQFANDPLNLLAVDGPTNNKKGDSDAATWLPPNKAFRCQYVARQVAVKQKYSLWITRPEFNAINDVLNTCPTQTIPTS